MLIERIIRIEGDVVTVTQRVDTSTSKPAQAKPVAPRDQAQPLKATEKGSQAPANLEQEAVAVEAEPGAGKPSVIRGRAKGSSDVANLAIAKPSGTGGGDQASTETGGGDQASTETGGGDPSAETGGMVIVFGPTIVNCRTSGKSDAGGGDQATTETEH